MQDYNYNKIYIVRVYKLNNLGEIVMNREKAVKLKFAKAQKSKTFKKS